MSLVNLAHVCSHLQNASLARLSLTSVPLSRLHLTLGLSLQKQGFLSTVDIGGSTPPTKYLPALQATNLSNEESSVSSQPSTTSTHEESSVMQTNRASRRLWLGLKYWDGDPVLSKMQLVSKPTRRIHLSAQDVAKVVRGKNAGHVKGMTRVGECMFLSTDKGIMEARDCAERLIGGLILCRVW